MDCDQNLQELVKFLEDNGFKDLIDSCNANGVDSVDTLKQITLDTNEFEELVPHLGQRVKLKSKLLSYPVEFSNPQLLLNDCIPPINQLLTTQRFYATGCTQLSAGAFFGFSKSSANRIIVSCAIAALRPLYITFPEAEREIRKAQLGFYNIAKFPQAAGAMDCIHVKIKNTGGENTEYFRNRKGYFSYIHIQCQITQIRSRNSVERVFGIWKRRFPVLALGMQLKLKNMFPVITATAVLHNIVHKAGEPLPPDDHQLNLPVPWDALLAEGIRDDVAIEDIRNHPELLNPNMVTRRLLIDNDKTNLMLIPDVAVPIYIRLAPTPDQMTKTRLTAITHIENAKNQDPIISPKLLNCCSERS